jgi:hypothetical protein
VVVPLCFIIPWRFIISLCIIVPLCFVAPWCFVVRLCFETYSCFVDRFFKYLFTLCCFTTCLCFIVPLRRSIFLPWPLFWRYLWLKVKFAIGRNDSEINGWEMMSSCPLRYRYAMMEWWQLNCFFFHAINSKIILISIFGEC